MNIFFSKIQHKYGYSNNQIAQLKYLFHSVIAESTKFFLIGGIFLYLDKFTSFVIASFVLATLRVSSGGIHFYRYVYCLGFSFFYLLLSVQLLPLIPTARSVEIGLLFLCIAICSRIEPVVSKYRIPLTLSRKRECIKRLCGLLIIYTGSLLIIPYSQFHPVCFWVIVLHTIQLTISNFLFKKGEKTYELCNDL